MIAGSLSRIGSSCGLFACLRSDREFLCIPWIPGPLRLLTAGGQGSTRFPFDVLGFCLVFSCG